MDVFSDLRCLVKHDLLDLSIPLSQTQFRTENRFTLFLELLWKPAPEGDDRSGLGRALDTRSGSASRGNAGKARRTANRNISSV
ncbi:MAG: hypothetical protein E5X48_33665 [Mesorhizobium sp.]|nr:MAG: hypothetical protein E5X48_33665 [Mesorhizobium sp.]